MQNEKEDVSNLSPWDAPAKNDLFGRQPFVDSIVKTLEDSNLDEGFNFGISARWGEGKSSILEQLEPKLVKLNYKLLKFHPWKYTQDKISIKRKFIIDIYTQLGKPIDEIEFYGQSERQKDLPEKEMSDIFWKRLISFFSFSIITALIFLGFLFLYKAVSGVDINISQIFLSNLFLPILIGIMPVLQKVLEISVKQVVPKIESAEQFETKFENVINELMEGKNPPKRIVIFVDDLDRCNHDEVEQVLTALFTFFSNPHCIYVITADHMVIRRYISKFLNLDPVLGKDGEINHLVTHDMWQKEATEYLKKIFQINFILPKATKEVLQPWIESLIKQLSIIDFKNPYAERYLVDSILNNFDNNPRKIKHFIRTLTFQLNAVEEKISQLSTKEGKEYDNLKIVKDSPELLAKILIIQDRFPAFYEQLGTETKLLQRYELGEIAEDKELQKLLSQEPKFFNSINRPDNPTIDPYFFLYFSGSTGYSETRSVDPTEVKALAKSGDFENLKKLINGLTDEPRNQYIEQIKSEIDAPDIQPPEKTNLVRSLIHTIALIEQPRIRLQRLRDLLSKRDKYTAELSNVQSLDLETTMSFIDTDSANILIKEVPFTNPDTKVQVMNAFVSQCKIVSKEILPLFLNNIADMLGSGDPTFASALDMCMRLEPKILSESATIQDTLSRLLKEKPINQKGPILDVIEQLRDQFSDTQKQHIENVLLELLGSDNVENAIFVLGSMPSKLNKNNIDIDKLSQAFAARIESANASDLPQLVNIALHPTIKAELGSKHKKVLRAVISHITSADQSNFNLVLSKISELIADLGVEEVFSSLLPPISGKELPIVDTIWKIKDIWVGESNTKKKFLAAVKKIQKESTAADMQALAQQIIIELEPKKPVRNAIGELLRGKKDDQGGI